MSGVKGKQSYLPSREQACWPPWGLDLLALGTNRRHRGTARLPPKCQGQQLLLSDLADSSVVTVCHRQGTMMRRKSSIPFSNRNGFGN